MIFYSLSTPAGACFTEAGAFPASLVPSLSPGVCTHRTPSRVRKRRPTLLQAPDNPPRPRPAGESLRDTVTVPALLGDVGRTRGCLLAAAESDEMGLRNAPRNRALCHVAPLSLPLGSAFGRDWPRTAAGWQARCDRRLAGPSHAGLLSVPLPLACGGRAPANTLPGQGEKITAVLSH